VWRAHRGSGGEARRPSLPEGLRIYAIGDIHGRADLLGHLLGVIDQDMATAPPGRVLQIFLGDYIDRGPNPRGTIDLLIERASKHETVFLKGNHESVLLETLSDPLRVDRWIRIGALSTLLSYGVRLPSSGEGDRRRDLVAAFAVALPDDHRRFFANLRLTFSCGDFFFAHAGARPGIALEHQSEQDLIWIRREFLESNCDFGKFIVHGHTPVRQPDMRENRINIDTGAYATNNLTSLRIEGDRMAII
jgi:serine/threonine protein phosphatase 1